jgi:hypothetical protein
MIFMHLLVNDNQLYNDARWIQREIQLKVVVSVPKHHAMNA